MVLELAPETVQRVRAIAESQHTSEDRVVVDLIESGLESRRYAELVEKLALSTDPLERKNLKEELALLTFGE
jgi:hypothetical protein